MKLFAIGFGTAVKRFYLMMAIVIVAGFIGQFWLAVFSLPVFLSVMLGVKFGAAEKDNVVSGKIRNMTQGDQQLKQAV